MNVADISEAVVVGPQDLLVLRFHRNTTAEQMFSVRKLLDERYPHWSDRMLIVGCEQFAVVTP